MVEVMQVEHLKIDPAATHIRVLANLVDDFVPRSGEAVVPQLVQVAANGCGAPTRLGLIPPGADCQGIAEGESGEVTPGRARHHTDILEQPSRLLDGHERQVEVRRIAPGQLRVRRLPVPPITIGTGVCTGFGSAGESTSV